MLQRCAGDVALDTLDLRGSSVRGLRVRSGALRVLDARHCRHLEWVSLAHPVELLDLHNCSSLEDLSVAYQGPQGASTAADSQAARHAELCGCTRLSRNVVDSVKSWATSVEHDACAAVVHDLFPRV